MSLLECIFRDGENIRPVDVTPELARKVLEEGNYGNRKVRPAVVKKYARAMKTGDWRYSPETISISRNGRLLNGQHRMMAVIESEVPCKFLFVTGFDDDVFAVIDRGTGRNNADALGMEKRLVECGTLLARSASAERTVTDADIMRASKAIEAAHQSLIGYCNTSARLFSSAPFRLACLARVMEGTSEDYAFGLYRNLVLSYIENLPPIGNAAIRAVLVGRFNAGGGRAQAINLSRAWDIFNPQSKMKSKIYTNYNGELVAQLVRATGYEPA